MIDDTTFVWVYEPLGLAQGKKYGDVDFLMVVTATLCVKNYRAPLPAGSDAVIRVRHEKSDGRKKYITGFLCCGDSRDSISSSNSLKSEFKSITMDTHKLHSYFEVTCCNKINAAGLVAECNFWSW